MSQNTKPTTGFLYPNITLGGDVGRVQFWTQPNVCFFKGEASDKCVLKTRGHLSRKVQTPEQPACVQIPAQRKRGDGPYWAGWAGWDRGACFAVAAPYVVSH